MQTQPIPKIDWAAWKAPKPFGISGCFRLRNESQFMIPAVLSHLPFLNEAVLVVQPSEDDTIPLAYELEREFEKIRVVEYPIIVDWIDTPGFYSKNPDEPGHLVHMSNFALSQCKYSWICKVEGDVVALSSTWDIVEAINEAPGEICYFGRVILNLAGADLDQISATVPRNGGWDEAFFNNNPDYWHFERVSKWEQIPLKHWHKCMGWSGLHLKRCKEKNIGWNNEQYVPFTRDNVAAALHKYNQSSPYPGLDGYPVGADCLFEFSNLKKLGKLAG